MCVTADSADEDGYDSLLPVELPVSEVYLHMDTNETAWLQIPFVNTSCFRCQILDRLRN